MKFDQIILAGTEEITLFDLKYPRSTPYTARTIDGLGPTDVDVTLAQTVGGTGIYIGRREQLREITLNVYLNPDYVEGQTPEKLREDIYLLTPITEDQSLDFRLMLDNVEVASTPVYLKRVEISPFSKDTILQIVLASTSGTFSQKNPVVLLNEEYSRSNPVLRNEGTAPSGFRLQLKFNTTINEFGIKQHYPTNELVLKKIPTDPNLFLANDILVIDTNIGHRGVWRTRGGIEQSLMGSLTQDSVWLTLKPGDNELNITNSPTHNNAFNWWRIEHTPKYKGV